MGELPAVSIIIPAHNEEATLERCLASLENLDYPSSKLEIILINDGSTDGTKKIIEGYIRKSKYNCKYLETEGVGAPKARNIGLNSAKGEYVAFTDADCVVERDWLMNLVKNFNEKLVNCEDEELDYRINERGYKILYTPDAKVYHYRRPTWKKFAKMAYSYAVGRMQAIKLHRKMGKWFHYMPPAIISGIILLLILSLLNTVYLWWALSILVIGGIGIGLMGLYLGVKTKMSNFLTYCMLIAIWFRCSGFGYFRGLMMRKKEFDIVK